MRRQRMRWNIVEVAFRECERLGRFEIAQHQEHSIIRRVVGAEKSLHIVERGGVEIVEIAIKIVRVGPIAERHWRQVQPGKSAVRLIHHVDANFFFHYVALIAQIFIVHFQRAHAVGFKPQHAFQCIGRHGFKIIGDVVIRGAVQQAAGSVDQANVFHLAGVFRALEHHVLKKVRKTAAAARLKAEADLIVNADGDERRGMVGRDDDSQAVGEFCVLDRNMQLLQLLPPVDFLSARFNCFDAAEFFDRTRLPSSARAA